MENQDKKPNIIAIIGAIALLVLAVVGLSYAFFSAFIKNGETDTSIEGTGANLSLVYTDGKSVITSSNIMPGWSATKTFTVTNNGEADTYYKLNISNITNEFVEGGLTFSLASADGGTSVPEQVVGTTARTLTNSIAIAQGKTHTYTVTARYINLDKDQAPDLGKSFSYTIGIEASRKDFTPDGWFEAANGTLLAALRDNNELKTPLTTPGAEVNAHVLDDVEAVTEHVDSTYQKYYVTYGTGWEANGTKFNLTGAAVTSDTYANSYSSLVGKYLIDSYIPNTGSKTAGTMMTTTNLSSVYYVVSATQDSFTYKTLSSTKNTTEALLARTEDDYGTSYYFRGAVKNNYVEFANKCWRIVRIGGDGTTKLILHNNNMTNDAYGNISPSPNPCSKINIQGYTAFATENSCAFNSNGDDNAYVGFMYGTTGASDYASTHANINKSTILTDLETWYTKYLESYADKIADTTWCNDKNNITDLTFNPNQADGASPTGLGYGKNKTYYAAVRRLKQANGSPGGSGPSLKCNGNLSKITNKIGLLTADEVAFSGATANTYNQSIYLQENTENQPWWLMTPYDYDYDFDSGSAYSYYIDKGSLGQFPVALGVNNYLRPAISLVSDIEISGGTGTSEDPYIVK